MKEIITSAIKEAIQCYFKGSNGYKPENGFYLTIHPKTSFILMETPEWRIDFNGDQMTKHWERTTVIEDVEMQIGHFKLSTHQL